MDEIISYCIILQKDAKNYSVLQFHADRTQRTHYVYDMNEQQKRIYREDYERV